MAITSNPILLLSTLDGSLLGVDKNSGMLIWTLQEGDIHVHVHVCTCTCVVIHHVHTCIHVAGNICGGKLS